MRKMILIFAVLVMVFSLSGNASAFLDNVTNDNDTNDIDTSSIDDIDNNPVTNVIIPCVAETTVNNNGQGYRGFASPAETNFPGMPGFFGQTTKGPMFQDVGSMLEYKNTFTLDELNKMAKNNIGMGFLGTKVIVTPLVDKVDEIDRVDTMAVVMVKPEKAILKGYITVKATNDGKVSPEVMAEAMLAARKLGADAIHVTAEGVQRVMKAFGWGIGLAYTKATISNDETTGGVASGGTGIAGGEAGYNDRPWIQLFAIDIIE